MAEENKEAKGLKLMYDLTRYIEHLIIEEVADLEDIMEFLKLVSYTHFSNDETDNLFLVDLGMSLPKGSGYVTVEEMDESYTVVFDKPEEEEEIVNKLKNIYEV